MSFTAGFQVDMKTFVPKMIGVSNLQTTLTKIFCAISCGLCSVYCKNQEEEKKVEHDFKYVDNNIDHSWKHLSLDQVSKLVGVFLFNFGVEGNLPYLSILIDQSNLGHARQAILGNRTSNPYNPCFMVPCRNTARVIARCESPYRL